MLFGNFQIINIQIIYFNHRCLKTAPPASEQACFNVRIGHYGDQRNYDRPNYWMDWTEESQWKHLWMRETARNSL